MDTLTFDTTKGSGELIGVNRVGKKAWRNTEDIDDDLST